MARPYQQVIVELPVVPISKGRVRVTSKGTYTPKRTQQAETEYAATYKDLKIARFEGPLKVSVVFFKDKVRLLIEEVPDDWVGTPSGDVDNLLKTLGDGLNGVAWRDDKQIKHWDARKAKRGEV